jgi:L-asparaginase
LGALGEQKYAYKGFYFMIKLLPITMGGTIASTQQEDALTPTLRFSQLIKEMQLHTPEHLLNDFTIAPEISPLRGCGLDSSELQNHHIELLAQSIIDNYEAYDAFLITHGTDTMALSAAHLSFLLQGLDKPIIFTGSQKTLSDESHDIYTNLADALKVIKHRPCGVWIVFAQMLLSGINSTKIDTEALNAFSSTTHTQIPIETFLAQESPNTVLQKRHFSSTLSNRVEILYLSQNITPKTLEALLHTLDVEALIILIPGMGGGREAIWQTLASFKAQKDILIVAKSQCAHGVTDLSHYSVGAKAKALGIYAAQTMSLEALYAKLCFLLASSNDIKQLTLNLQTNLIGELLEQETITMTTLNIEELTVQTYTQLIKERSDDNAFLWIDILGVLHIDEREEDLSFEDFEEQEKSFKVRFETLPLLDETAIIKNTWNEVKNRETTHLYSDGFLF